MAILISQVSQNSNSRATSTLAGLHTAHRAHVEHHAAQWLKVSPFEAAHGLPARGVQNHTTAADYAAPNYMGSAGIKAMQTTAAAFVTHLRQVQMQEARDRAEELNLRGSTPKLKVGDKVVFFIPPTVEEADMARRKVKHLPKYRGPASITKVMTPTTYELQFNGHTYKRCLSELRPYKAAKRP